MDEKFTQIEQEIKNLKDRNLRVERDKAWEVSLFRKMLIAIITYIIAAIVLYCIGASNYLLGALIPTIGYVLSTQSLPVIKNWWIKCHRIVP